MATEKQILANQLNAQLSTGPTSEAGVQASSQNNFRHGLAPRHHEVFTFMKDEEPAKFGELVGKLLKEHAPQGETQKILVRRMAESEWLRARAVRLQTDCFTDYDNLNEKRLALFIRYETTHERAFYRALKELQTIRKEKRNTEIEQFEWKKIVTQTKKESPQTKKGVREAAETTPGDQEMAA